MGSLLRLFQVWKRSRKSLQWEVRDQPGRDTPFSHRLSPK